MSEQTKISVPDIVLIWVTIFLFVKIVDHYEKKKHWSTNDWHTEEKTPKKPPYTTTDGEQQQQQQK